ncbi:Rv3654c family TadE-like protein [Pseudactinotalea sp. Z1748]|uniref:Rv3654c family TadE-like protein n=1 Tax=Pseudactinotalea sp. Z1748 TaxID=3413027 RepID=UPI003C799CD0
MLGVVSVALVLALGLGALARSTHAQARAQGVADLAALAAAHEYARSGVPGCPVAARVAAWHQVQLTECRAVGPLVQVHVAVSLQPLPGWRTRAHAGARAGPVGIDPLGARATSRLPRGSPHLPAPASLLRQVRPS